MEGELRVEGIGCCVVLCCAAMGKMRNQAVVSNHFRKHWRRFVVTWFDQPMRKLRRRQRRMERARVLAPRPASSLRPVIRCPTTRYNQKLRLGRGFSLEELKVLMLMLTGLLVEMHSFLQHPNSNFSSYLPFPSLSSLYPLSSMPL